MPNRKDKQMSETEGWPDRNHFMRQMHSSLILQEFISLLDVIRNIFLIVGLDVFLSDSREKLI